ncbi:MAG TPA: DegV family protein [Gemmatimonadota bacterium]|nr:DegV family protein [Gemmatimonadota bacterium]
MRSGSVALVTDSTAEIHALDPGSEWHVVPLELEIDGRRLKEGPELSADEFHRLFQRVNTVPATLPPSIDAFASAYAPLLARHDAVLSIHLSGGLSDTVLHAREAARRLGAADLVTIVDSRLAGLALGLLCREAETRLAEGATVGETKADLDRIIAACRVYFSVFTLDFLYLSGRLARSSRPDQAAAGASHAADDRPILTLENGRLSLVERVIGETTRVQRIAELLEGEYGVGEPLIAGSVHAGRRGDEAAARLEQALTAALHPGTAWYRSPLGPVLCAHTGFDVCGIAVYPRRLSKL